MLPQSSGGSEMAQAWTKDHETGAGWLPAVLRDHCYAIASSVNAPLLAISAGAGPAHSPVLQSGHGESWLLFAPPGTSAYVNGQRLPLGMRVLRDRDEILVPVAANSANELGEPQRMFFSTERLAIIQPFPGAA